MSNDYAGIIEATRRHLNNVKYRINNLEAELTRLRAENAELRKDKERLDWMMTKILAGGAPNLFEHLGTHTIISRQAIDAAIQTEKEPT
jgi:chromosome segregation ATPase